jgi:hypothetical protein
MAIRGFGWIQGELAGFGGEELKAEARLVGEDGVVHGPVSRGVSGGGELGGFGGGRGHGVDFHKGEVAVHKAEAGPEVRGESFHDLVGE